MSTNITYDVSASERWKRVPTRFLFFLFLSTLILGVVVNAKRLRAEIELADTPMLALVKAPPANIMMLLDDSGSMTFEILIKGAYDGSYPSPDSDDDEHGYCYIFPYLGDNAYTTSGWYMDAESRKNWRSQHYRDNVIYYNPIVDYAPWLDFSGQSFGPADTENPNPHPTKTGVTALDLDETSFTVRLRIDADTEQDLDIKYAHYFVMSAGIPYLVVIDGDVQDIKYYKVIETDGIGLQQKVLKIEEVSGSELPPEIRSTRTYNDERQNFANWFTYHRRREYVAKAAIAKVIKSVEGVRIGILGINGEIIVPLKPVEAKIDGERRNEQDALLQSLYAYDSYGGTPLREGLNDVGQYLKTNSITLSHHEGGNAEGDLSPYFTEEKGGACQQCFTIVMTDGYYSYPGQDYIDVGNADGTSAVTDFDRNALADALSDTLADVAMYYYENDLRPDNGDPDDPGLSNYVPAYGFDEATHQHMLTYGVAFGVDGNLNRNDYNLNSIYNNGSYTVPWPTSIPQRQPQTIDDLWHATLNGRGEFYSADNPQQLTEKLLELTKSISERFSGSAAPVSINGNQLYEVLNEEIVLYQCSYIYEDENREWIGDVKAYGFDADEGSFDTANPLWSAATQLQVKNWNARRIATYDPIEMQGKVFDYDNLTNDQKKNLGWDEIEGSEAEQEAINRVNYIKGMEISGFRERSQKLGDIVHSAPVFENDVVYVGANDGMLHAFNAKDPGDDTDAPILGEELFAYIPNLVFQNLAAFTSPDYDHHYYVDLTPTVQPGVTLPSGSDKTILIGGLGKGGKGYFALDITDPFSMDTTTQVAEKVLWEFPVSADDDMGFSYSKPVIVPSYDDQNPWIIIFGNGYGSPNGNAVLYILNPAKQPSGDLLVKKFELGGGPDNGVSSATPVDVDFDRIVDYVYVGDLKGNIWKFDLTAENAADWDVAFSDGSTPKPLFTAAGPDNAIQPITSKVEVTPHPKEEGYIVFFGTGKFLGDGDFVDASVQTVYGIWDYGDDEDDSEYIGTLTRGADGSVAGLSNLSGTSTLLQHNVKDFAYALPNGEVINVRVLSPENPDETKPIWITEPDVTADQDPDPSTTESNHLGWYFDLSDRERVDTDVLLREGRLIVIGFIPDNFRCKGGGGNSVFMEVDALTGGNLDEVVLDTTSGGILNENDLVTYVEDTREITKPPSGLLFEGKLQMPAILRINAAFQKSDDDDDNDGLDKPDDDSLPCGEEKYLSTSTGEIKTICEKSISLGVGHWKEIYRE
ncbi:MAG: PilC/PilY family type IV pilus protein [Desulfobacterales bacterium]|jgi:type IV pilus assembly protein PilY1